MHSYSPAKQQLVVTACCVLHNFIHKHNWSDNLFHAWEEQDVEVSLYVIQIAQVMQELEVARMKKPLIYKHNEP